jgi:hypothetical protein
MNIVHPSFPRRACPRADGGGNPGVFALDSRLRGSDNHFVTYL